MSRGRPRIDPSETMPRTGITLGSSLAAEIDEWRARLPGDVSRSAAIRHLVERGLEAERQQGASPLVGA